ncbi:hypothetical protein ABG067_000370 [Albugo candida]|uniref:Uncharacterized protein n=1 Tax=Albugo candida TaxID=65357 RepID=A0A024G3J7_9STRA|nr:unnamed protein product [Albugo candida]|eukprot:CCI41251.1 unnamed protein product [Albugo candida]
MRHNPQDQTSKEHNFKEIERLFVSYKIVKDVPIQKLCAGIFQAHFEFLHWMHYHENVGHLQNTKKKTLESDLHSVRTLGNEMNSDTLEAKQMFTAPHEDTLEQESGQVSRDSEEKEKMLRVRGFVENSYVQTQNAHVIMKLVKQRICTAAEIVKDHKKKAQMNSAGTARIPQTKQSEKVELHLADLICALGVELRGRACDLSKLEKAIGEQYPTSK